MLVPVIWEQGWPVIGMHGNSHVNVEIETSLLPCTGTNLNASFESRYYIPGRSMVDTFDTDSMHPSWNTIYNPDYTLYDFTKNGLILHGNENDLSSSNVKSILCRRQEHFDFTAQLTLCMETIPENGESGLAIYMNNRHHYEIAMTMIHQKRCLIIRRQIGRLNAVENIIEYENNTVILQLTGSREEYTFAYCSSEQELPVTIGSGEAQYLTTEVGGCFTGNYIAIYATDADAICKKFVYDVK